MYLHPTGGLLEIEIWVPCLLSIISIGCIEKTFSIFSWFLYGACKQVVSSAWVLSDCLSIVAPDLALYLVLLPLFPFICLQINNPSISVCLISIWGWLNPEICHVKESIDKVLITSCVRSEGF
jgi:hypothetical protein